MPRTLSRRYCAPANWFWLEIPGLARCRKGGGQKHDRNHRLRFNLRPLEAYQPEDLKVAPDRQSRPCSVFSALSPPFVGSGYIVVDCLDGPASKIRFVPEPGPESFRKFCHHMRCVRDLLGCASCTEATRVRWSRVG